LAYRARIDALRERYLQLIAARDELDASIDGLPGLDGGYALELGELYERRHRVSVELDDVASRIDAHARRVPDPAREDVPPTSGASFGRDVLLALALAGAIGVGIASLAVKHERHEHALSGVPTTW
jgi:hypothetical protein